MESGTLLKRSHNRYLKLRLGNPRLQSEETSVPASIFSETELATLHALRRFLFFAHEGKVQRRQANQQTNQVLCLNLVTKAIVTWNTVYMNAAIERLRAEGRIGPRPRIRWGIRIEVESVPEFLRKVTAELRKRHPSKQPIPENLPLLRAMQFVLHWGREKAGHSIDE